MNNAFIRLEPTEPSDNSAELRKEELRRMEAKAVKIIEALREIQETKAWSSLKDEVFDSLVESLTKQLLLEAQRESPEPTKLNFIRGKLVWAEKYADLDKLAKEKALELQRIRQQLYGTKES